MASSSSPAISPHDLFLSFRGEDVRCKFRSHFFKELERKLIPFKDEEMERGRSTTAELNKAIQGSRISVVAFSHNFANSSWCLNELVEIMRCRERGLIVIPIFYEVDPSHVRKQSGDFGKIFEKTCEGRTEEEKLQWSKALTDAANITGEDSSTWSDEAKMVEKIVNDVSNKLISTSSADFADFVGIEDHIKNMNSLLNLESEEVIMVGVWGPSGVGKTTIGRALFNQLSHQFLPSIFIDKTKENFTRAKSDDYNTHVYLQTQFLAEVLDQKDVKIHGLGAVKERLGHKRVFVVFDDVDDHVLLNALVRETTWFGPRSRIIVISKDRELLMARGIKSDRIYEMCFPPEELALRMFCRCAFGQDSPPDGFMELATEAVKLTGYLPLGINVLGSSLAVIKNKEEWADRLPKLRDSMVKQIDKPLRDSYDRLDEGDKATFLHIACLFNHKPRDYVIRLLEDSKLNVDVGLVTLAERYLIQISEDKIIRMHDFLQNMGREIVRQPFSRSPGERPFLMDSQDICDLLVDGTGTSSVLGIFLNLSEIKNTFDISKKAFRKMKDLRFLSIYGVLREDVEVILPLQYGKEHMWRQLRLLEWWGCPMRCMPSNFRPENLIELRMPDSHLETLWHGAQLLRSLKKMDLRRSKKLKEIPDLSKATKLEELYLEDCCKLVMIPLSFQNLNRLRKLDMKRCKNLQILPKYIHLESLHSLNFSGCSKLTSFPQISRNISLLFLDETEIVEVPWRIEYISGLNYILMNGCSSLRYISPIISKMKHLEVMFFSNSDALVEASWYDSPSAVATTTNNRHTDLPDSSPSGNWLYDVFLSFRGDDVRKGFLGHMIMKLKSKGINIYSDHEMTRGQPASTTLVHGIRKSRIAIVVLSESYASSKWGLDELVNIIRCSKEIGQKVLPVYHYVDPVHIRTQIQDLSKTFDEWYSVDKMQNLLQALTVLDQLQGYHMNYSIPEAKVVEKIAVDISFALTTEPERVPMIPDQETEKSFKLHYNGLNGNEKVLFRHIACFLNNETYENVTQLFEDSELDVVGSLKILYEKSLIQISEERVISMHHVLQKIGREIVLGPFIGQPAYRQFLEDSSEVFNVLIDQTGTENVFGISFKVSEMEDRLKGMKKLQFKREYKQILYGKEVRVHLVKGLHSLWERLSNI